MSTYQFWSTADAINKFKSDSKYIHLDDNLTYMYKLCIHVIELASSLNWWNIGQVLCLQVYGPTLSHCRYFLMILSQGTEKWSNLINIPKRGNLTRDYLWSNFLVYFWNIYFLFKHLLVVNLTVKWLRVGIEKKYILCHPPSPPPNVGLNRY